MGAAGRLVISLTMVGEGMLFIGHVNEPSKAIPYGLIAVATVIGFSFFPHASPGAHGTPRRLRAIPKPPLRKRRRDRF